MFPFLLLVFLAISQTFSVITFIFMFNLMKNQRSRWKVDESQFLTLVDRIIYEACLLFFYDKEKDGDHIIPRFFFEFASF